MGDAITSEEQEAAYQERQKQLAEERVARREKLGQVKQDEPLLAKKKTSKRTGKRK